MFVHCFSFEGHGGETSLRSFSIDVFVENIVTFLEDKHLKKIDVFGYSMGGYVALKCALLHPEKIGKIITLGTKFDWTPASASKEVKLLNPRTIEEKIPKFAQKLKEEHAPLDWKDVMQKTARMMLELGNGGLISDGDLEKIKHSVVIARGTQDAMVSKEESELTVQKIPNSIYLELVNGQHPIEKIDMTQLVSLINEN